MKKIAALSVLAVVGLAGSAFGVATGNIEFRFVTIDSVPGFDNTTGLASGTVLGANTVITPAGATVRQRIALQGRAINIGGDFTSQQLNATQTALQNNVVSPAQNLGIFAYSGSLGLSDGAFFAPAALHNYAQGLAGVVSGASWTGFQRSVNLGVLAEQAWTFPNAAPAPANPTFTGAGGAWVSLASFIWESNDLSPRTISGNFTPLALGNSAFIGNGVPSATIPSLFAPNGNITYGVSQQAAGIDIAVSNFSFLIEGGMTNTDPDVLSTPAVITADPFVNPDALNLVLASFTDADGDSIAVAITNDGGIGALGGSVSIVGNNGLAPTIVLNWDAPNAAIGNTYDVSFTYTDGQGNTLTGQSSVSVVPAPGALALLGLGGLVAGRRRRA